MSIFSFSKVNKTKYSTFNMSHDVKLSCEMGQLIPFFCEEVLPGDKWKLTSEHLVRMAPMLAPLMHRVDIRTEYFFVPNRILTPAWEKVMFPKPNIEPSVQIPYLNLNDYSHDFGQSEVVSWTQSYDGVETPRTVYAFDRCSLADYLGITSNVANNMPNQKISALPFLAYQRIYNDYYRDENLMPDLQDMQDDQFSHPNIPFVGDGNNLFDLVGNLTYNGTGLDDLATVDNTLSELLALRSRCWEKDYFTSALPWRQAGNPAIAPLQFDSSGRTVLRNSSGDPVSSTTGTNIKTYSSSRLQVDGVVANIDNTQNLGLSIADLQTASWLQRFLENIALGGSRSVEQILTHFGVRVPDYRLDRAEYLGGNRTPLSVGQVLQTSSSVSDSPLANPAGNAKSVGVNQAISKTFQEHGWIMGIISVVPRTSYCQGIPRKLQRFDRLDFAWPEFAMLGEQPVYNKELFVATSGTEYETWNNDVFGYQQRYAEYKYINSTVHGDFADTLNFWDMTRVLADRPNLNSQFVKCSPTSRIWSVPSATNHVWMLIHNNVLANRPLPQVSNSSLA